MEVITELFKLDFSSLVFSIFIILSSIIAVYEIIGKFSKIIGKPVKWVRKRDRDHNLLIQTSDSLEQLRSDHEESVKQSINHDEAIRQSVSELQLKIDAITRSVDEMRNIQDQDKLAEYKDRIGQSYRYYVTRRHSDEEPVPYWNKMEKNALTDLIKQYEAHGGKNSFVHSIVEPECEKWKVI